MATMAPIDDLFRQKTLQEIHGVLKQTRADVEAKKQELRELVGDHYRSVLESSDHIRAMSECAAKVSLGADHIEELIASMRSLAANPPTSNAGLLTQTQASASSPEDDHEYRVSLRVMELLEVPDNVGAFLHEHKFVRAARVALVDAAALQSEVDDLLGQRSNMADGSPDTFNFGALARQQAAAFRNLPVQISASCEDAFSAVSLAPANAAECFAVRLVLDASVQPAPLLRKFLDRRRELVRSLLAGAGGDSMSCGARLAAAAAAYEGTVVVAAELCEGALEVALAAVFEDAPERDALEERAAIQGQQSSSTGFSSLRRRGEGLGQALRRGGSAAETLKADLSEVGTEIAREWVPLDAGGQSCRSSTSGASARSLSDCFLQLVSSDDAMRECSALGATLSLCSEKVLSYRRVLAKGTSDSWSSTWATACAKFCPGRPVLDDALSIITATVEAACVELARERVGDLQLELVPASEDDADTLEASATSAGESSADQGGGEMRRRAELFEMQRQSRLRVQRLDEQLGEILADLAHVAPSSGEPVSAGVSRALLEALRKRLSVACEAVRLPGVTALWPRSGQDGSNPAADAPRSWSQQRGAARAAVALDALLAAASEMRDSDDPGTSHLRGTLRMASSSGEAGLMRQAQAIVEELQQRSDAAFNSWARLAVASGESTATLEAYWRLGDDEVPHACGWGNAKFVQKGAAGRDDSSKAVPVPVQGSSFVFERLTLGARRALEVSGGLSPMSRALVVALKVALAESFMAAYEAQPVDFQRLKHFGMSRLLQWLFDLRFLQNMLSTPAPSSKAYEALCELHDKAEAAILSDPVDRRVYLDVLKAAVKSHIEGVKILLSPFFLHNPSYLYLFPTQGAGGVELGALAGGPAASPEEEGFELQTTFAPPLRPMLPQRFPLLPVAMTSALAGGSSAELDARLGLSADSAERAAARMSGANPGAPSVSSLMQSVGSGLGSFGFGKQAKSFFGGGSGDKPQAV